MNKIAIVGSPGSGKSTLARELGSRLNIEVIHLDRFFWQKNWQETPRDAWKDFQRYLVQLPRWVIDGTYLSTSDIRLEAADTIIFLDRSHLLCLWRVIKRHYQYIGRSRPDFSEECRDKLNWKYFQKVWFFPEIDRPALLENISKYQQGKTCYTLHSQREINRFLQSLPAQQPALSKPERQKTLLLKMASVAMAFLGSLYDNLGAANLSLPLAASLHPVAPLEHHKPLHRF